MNIATPKRPLAVILALVLLLIPGHIAAQDDLFPADNVRNLRVLTLLQHEATVVEAEFSPGGTVFLTGTLDGQLYVWQAGADDDWTRGELRFVLEDYIPGATLTAFDADETRMAHTAGADGTAIEIRDMENGELIASFEEHAAHPDSIAFMDDVVVSTDFNGDLFIWDAEDGESTEQFSDVLSHSVSSDGDMLAILTSDQTLTYGPVDAPEERVTIEDDAARSLEFSPGGRWLASWGTHLTVWEAEDGEQRFREQDLRPDRVIWSPDSSFIITTSFADAQVWAVSENEEREFAPGDLIDEFPSFADAGGLRQLTVAPNGERAVSVDLTGVARLWRINADGEVDQIRSLQGLIDDIIISPDSETIVGFRQDFLVRFWNVNGDLRGEIDLPDTIVFSPDWRLLASYSNEIVAWRGFVEDDLTFDFPPIGRPQGRSNLREIPSEEIARIMGLDSTQALFAIGRTDDNEWFQIVLPDGTVGWVATNSLQIESTQEFISALPSYEVARTTPQDLDDELPFFVAPEPAPIDPDTGLTGCFSSREVLMLARETVDDTTYVQVDCGGVVGWLAENALEFDDE